MKFQKYRCVYVTTIAFVVFLLCGSASAATTTYTVKKDGTGDFTSIQMAIDTATTSSLIEVQDNSTYNENLLFNRKQTIQAGTGFSPTILCSGSPIASNAYIYFKQTSTLKGLTIRMSGDGAVDSHLILGGSGNIVENCTLIGPGTGTKMRGITNIGNIVNTDISGFRYGLLYDSSGNYTVIISGCTIHDCTDYGAQLVSPGTWIDFIDSTIKQTASGANIHIGKGKINAADTLVLNAGGDNVLINSGTVTINRSILSNPAANKSNINCVDNTSYPGAVSVTVDHCDMKGVTGQWNVLDADPDTTVTIKNSIITGDKGLKVSAGVIKSDYNDVFCTSPYDGLSAGTSDINVNPLYIQTTNPDDADYFVFPSNSPCATADEFGAYLGSKGATDQTTTVTLGVYYYPWYYNDFHGGSYLRKHLIPKQEPQLGEYNDHNIDTIKQHLDWSLDGGIKIWLTSWWGPGSREDVSTKDYIMPALSSDTKYEDIKFAIHYETKGRMGSDYSNTSNLAPDITHIADTYFSHPNYLKIKGKPVIVMYLTRVLSQSAGGSRLGSVLQIMRDAAAAKGYQLYIIGDQTSGGAMGVAADDVSAGLLDAITSYNVFGNISSKGYAGQTQIDLYYAQQSLWKVLADSVVRGDGSGVDYIPDVIPGFNNKATDPATAPEPLSRRLTASDGEGSLFRTSLHKAKNCTDPDIGNMIFITSWNEWHEDSQIEPVKLLTPPDNVTNVDDSPSGSDYTTGLYYESYGTLYLDILREEFMPPPSCVRHWEKY